ncbi:MAG: DNA ligase [Chloroflexi bacterium]|nr:DNA ligase [Chloroflexota bacterium]
MSQERFALSEAPHDSPGVLPRSIKPMLAVTGEEAFDSPAHVFELKWDGVRAIAFVESGAVRVQDRFLRDITSFFPEFAAVSGRVRSKCAALDGEIVALDSKGKPDFQGLQPRLAGCDPQEASALARRWPVTYQAFDILFWDGRSVMNLPLWRRKSLLHQVARPDSFLHTPEYVEREGIAFFEAARDHGLEGIVAKEKAGLYHPGQRGPTWVRLNVYEKGEFVIGGYTFGGGRQKKPLASLLVGVYDAGGRLTYAGEVTGPFNDDAARELTARLDPLQTPESPFPNPPRLPRLIFWCRPEMACSVRFGQWAREGLIRFPMFVVLRPDVPAAECRLEDVRSS